MKILLDCSHIATGGAIQNSLAVLHNARATRRHTWNVIMTGAMSRQLPVAHDSAFASVRRLDNWGPMRTRYAVHLSMPRWERALAPDVCFAPGGPVYWRSQARQVVAFALPHLIYPETDIFRGLRRHARWRLQLVLRAARRSFVEADMLVVQTETVRDRAARLLPFPRERIRLVKNSFSPTFAAGVKAYKPRANRERFVVLVPSAHYPHKNLESVVDVAREARRRGLSDIEFRLTLPPQSSGWRSIKARAESLGVADLVRPLGAVPHAALADEYCDADLVFLPTLLECSTAVYPESFMAGVPLVTSDLDFARELCGDGALYVDPMAPAAMADAIVQLARAPASRQTLVNAGRQILATNYVTPEEKWQAQLACMESG